MSTHFNRENLLPQEIGTVLLYTFANKLFRNVFLLVVLVVNVSADILHSVSQILDKNAFYRKCAFDLRSLFDEEQVCKS